MDGILRRVPWGGGAVVVPVDDMNRIRDVASNVITNQVTVRTRKQVEVSTRKASTHRILPIRVINRPVNTI